MYSVGLQLHRINSAPTTLNESKKDMTSAVVESKKGPGLGRRALTAIHYSFENSHILEGLDCKNTAKQLARLLPQMKEIADFQRTGEFNRAADATKDVEKKRKEIHSQFIVWNGGVPSEKDRTRVLDKIRDAYAKAVGTDNMIIVGSKDQPETISGADHEIALLQKTFDSVLNQRLERQEKGSKGVAEKNADALQKAKQELLTLDLARHKMRLAAKEEAEKNPRLTTDEERDAFVKAKLTRGGLFSPSIDARLAKAKALVEKLQKDVEVDPAEFRLELSKQALLSQIENDHKAFLAAFKEDMGTFQFFAQENAGRAQMTSVERQTRDLLGRLQAKINVAATAEDEAKTLEAALQNFYSSMEPEVSVPAVNPEEVEAAAKAKEAEVAAQKEAAANRRANILFGLVLVTYLGCCAHKTIQDNGGYKVVAEQLKAMALRFPEDFKAAQAALPGQLAALKASGVNSLQSFVGSVKNGVQQLPGQLADAGKNIATISRNYANSTMEFLRQKTGVLVTLGSGGAAVRLSREGTTPDATAPAVVKTASEEAPVVVNTTSELLEKSE